MLKSDISKVSSVNPHVVNNGVPDVKIFTVRKDYDFIFLSNLYESKGIFVFLNAICFVVKTFPNCRCAIVGKGSEVVISMIFNIINSANIRPNVDVLGPLYGIEKSVILNRSRIFILPTYNDCFPLSILEAMSVGMPVISTSVGAIPDIVEHMKTGIILEFNSPYCLAQSMSLLLSNSRLVEEMGSAARYKYANNYTENIFSRNMISVFEKK